MSQQAAIKVSIVGPSGSGKSTMANFLASDSDQPSLKPAHKYTPTVGVRILEIERDVDDMTQIEIWDAPGAPDYESCWPAIMKDTAGVAIVYDPEKEEHVSESGAWYDFFVKNNNLSDDQCIVFAFTAQRENTKKRKPSPKLEHLNIVNISSEDPRVLSQHFDRFLRTIKSTSTSKDHK